MNTLFDFRNYLIEEEKSDLTIEKYIRDTEKFLDWLGEQEITKWSILEYKKMLMENYTVTSVNSMLSSVNCYLSYAGLSDCRVKTLRHQRQVFLPENKELSRMEYECLIRATGKNTRLCLLMKQASYTVDLNGNSLTMTGTAVITDKGTANNRKIIVTSTAAEKGNMSFAVYGAMINSEYPADIEFSNVTLSCTGAMMGYCPVIQVMNQTAVSRGSIKYEFKNCVITDTVLVSAAVPVAYPAHITVENTAIDPGNCTNSAVVTYTDKMGYGDMSVSIDTLSTIAKNSASMFSGVTPTVPAGYVFADSDGDGWYMAERVKVEIEGNTGTEDAPEVEMTEDQTAVEVNNAEVLGDLESLTVTSNENVVLKFLSDALDSIGNLVTGSASISIEANANKTTDTTLVRYDLNVTNGEGEKVSFNGDVEIKIPFTPVAGIDASKYCAYHIDDEGNRQAVKTIVTGDETTGFFASFTIPHFSSVEIDRVADQYTAGLTTATTEVPSGGESVTIYVGVTHNNADQTSFNAAEIVITYDPAILVLDTTNLEELKAAGKLDYTNINGVLTMQRQMRRHSLPLCLRSMPLRILMSARIRLMC